MPVAIKPPKPRPDFPLTPHSSGKWVKKIRGQYFYFGRWDDPDAAEREWDRAKHDLRAGRVPLEADPDTLTVRELFNRYLSRQTDRVDSLRIKARSYNDLRGTLAAFAKSVGPTRLVTDLRPSDFASFRRHLEKRLSPSTVNRHLSHVKAAFRWGFNNDLLAKPAAMGDGFAPVPKAEKRRAASKRAREHGEPIFSPAECRKLVKAAPAPLKAMILLGLNAGYLAADVANLPRSALDLDKGDLRYDREKTGVTRAAVLWPETVKAMREAIAVRPKSRRAADDDTVFLTKYGNRWVHDRVHRTDEGISKVAHIDALGQLFGKLLAQLKIKRKGRGFSALRKTYRTAADDLAGERNAVLLTMGHAYTGMDEHYVRGVERKRLERVAVHVRRKLLNAK